VSDEPTGFLYPFIEAEEHDAGALLTDLAASARAKIAESRRLQEATLAARSSELAGTAAAMATRFAAGGRLFTFGNGGSATDAETTVDLFRHPHRGRALAAVSLVDDRAIVTALANDVGIELVFSRQLIAHGRAGDIAMGFSTSGGSANVLRAFAEATARGLLTVGLAGYGGGAMATSGHVDHCLVVDADSVHRVQEAQAALVHDLWRRVQQTIEIEEMSDG
jgi:D-sedoheptulose 7-phosphate isomerase